MNNADTRGFTVDAVRASIYADGGKMPETVVISGLNFGPINSGTCQLTGRPCRSNSECL